MFHNEPDTHHRLNVVRETLQGGDRYFVCCAPLIRFTKAWMVATPVIYYISFPKMVKMCTYYLNGISELFNMANIGYLMIGLWKDLSNKLITELHFDRLKKL